MSEVPWFDRAIYRAIEKYPHARSFLLVGFGKRSPESLLPPPPGKVTVVICAYNEELDIGSTIESILKQTLPIHRIIVMDDASKDRTGEIARALGTEVCYRPLKENGKTHGKAANQKYSLEELVDTEYIAFVDADTWLYPDAMAEAMPFFNEPNTKAVGGFVLPKSLRNVWELGRYCQYLYGFGTAKAGQNNVGAIFVSSGCHTVFETKALREVGLDIDTVAEDTDATWKMLAAKYTVRSAPDSMSLVSDPSDGRMYRKQQYRWQFGTAQNLKKRKWDLRKMGFWFALNTYKDLGLAFLGPLMEVWGFVGIYIALSTRILSSSELARTPFRLVAFLGDTMGAFWATLALTLFWIGVFSWWPVILSAWKLWRAKRITFKRFLLTFPGLICFVFLHYVDVPLFYKAFVDVMILGLKEPKGGWGIGHAQASSYPFERAEAVAARLLAKAQTSSQRVSAVAS